MRAAREGLQKLTDEIHGEHPFTKRSATAFLLEMCARLNVDLGIDTRIEDERLLHYRKTVTSHPLGIPPSHIWWGILEPAPPASEPDEELSGPFR